MRFSGSCTLQISHPLSGCAPNLSAFFPRLGFGVCIERANKRWRIAVVVGVLFDDVVHDLYYSRCRVKYTSVITKVFRHDGRSTIDVFTVARLVHADSR